MRWVFPTLIILATSLHHPVRAAVLTDENASDLCIASEEGKRVVDKDALAHVIVAEAGASRYLDGSNPTGLRDGTIQLKTGDGVPSEPVYVLLNYGTKAIPAENQPFGPNVNLQKNKQALQARDAISKVMREELFFLTENGSKVAGPTLTYRVQRRIVVGAPTEEIEWKNPDIIFQANPPLTIVCEETKGTTDPTPKTTEQTKGPSLVRLRGAVKDLTVFRADKLKDTKPASITYQRDDEAKKRTFGFNGVLGLRFGDDAGVVDALPYISYEKTSVTGKKGDVEKLSPGLLLGYKIEAPAFAIHARLETSLIDDFESDARQGKLRVYVDPAIALGSGRGVLFGSNLRAFGPLIFRPDFTLIGDASHIYDRGTSADLAKASSYFGLGGELSLRTRLNLGHPISDFVLNLGARRLQLFGDIRKSATRNWFGGLEYAPENFPYFGIGLSFFRGENNDTFQDEKKYGLNLSFRY